MLLEPIQRIIEYLEASIKDCERERAHLEGRFEGYYAALVIAKAAQKESAK